MAVWSHVSVNINCYALAIRNYDGRVEGGEFSFIFYFETAVVFVDAQLITSEHTRTVPREGFEEAHFSYLINCLYVSPPYHIVSSHCYHRQTLPEVRLTDFAETRLLTIFKL